MNGLYDSFKTWQPALLRGGLWVYIGMMTALLAVIRNLTPEEITELNLNKLALWWTATFAEVTNAGAIAARLFMDQSLSRHVDKVEEEQAGDREEDRLDREVDREVRLRQPPPPNPPDR